MYLTFTNNQLLSYMCAKLYRTLYTKINLSHMQYYLFSLVKSYYFLMQQKHYPSTILCQRPFYRPKKLTVMQAREGEGEASPALI